jgi:hypothetical protein
MQGFLGKKDCLFFGRVRRLALCALLSLSFFRLTGIAAFGYDERSLF